jgi:hypothetical protein
VGSTETTLRMGKTRSAVEGLRESGPSMTGENGPVAVRGNDMLAGEGTDGAKSLVSVTACEGEGRSLSRPAEGGWSELPVSEGLWRCDCGMAEVREVKNRGSRVEDRGSRAGG